MDQYRVQLEAAIDSSMPLLVILSNRVLIKTILVLYKRIVLLVDSKAQ